MSIEFSDYKQNKITSLQNIYYGNVNRLYSALLVNVKAIQNSRQSVKSKQQQIINLINKHNSNVTTLKKILDNNIISIQNYVLKPIIINKNKNALLIGINYTGTQNELYGCINDVIAVKDRISKSGFTNINVMTDLTAQKATRTNILAEFKKLLINSRAGDLLFFLYSGHGSYAKDTNGDEPDGYDELIVACDLNPIRDDEFKSLVQSYLKPNVTLFAMFDSCFSGTMLDLKYQYLNSLNYDKYTEYPSQTDTPGNVILVSGCTDEQTSADSVFNNKANGAMTWSLLEGLKQKPNCTWRELIKTMRDLLKNGNYEQIPQLSSGQITNIDAPCFV
jgi:hypothetical protein